MFVSIEKFRECKPLIVVYSKRLNKHVWRIFAVQHYSVIFGANKRKVLCHSRSSVVNNYISGSTIIYALSSIKFRPETNGKFFVFTYS